MADVSEGGSGSSDDPVVFLALGTRGDVQPMVSLARRLARALDRRVRIVTHAAFERALREQLADQPTVALRLLASPPAARWGELRETASPAEAEARLRAECVAACAGAAAIVFSLFSLEGHVLAEALGVSALAVSPYLIPYGCPADFGARLARARPELHAALLAADAPGASTLSLAEVEHWAWPLFDEPRWAAWRASLGLGPAPGLRRAEPREPSADARVALPPKTHLAYLSSPRALPPSPRAWPGSVRAWGYVPDDPPPPPPPPPHTPPRARECECVEEEEAAEEPICAGAMVDGACACAERDGPRVYVTLGSAAMLMGDELLGADGARALGACLEAACERLGARALLHLPRGCALARELGRDGARRARVRVVASDTVRVRALLRARHFRACVHHAGAGATADALLSGTPSVVLPLHYDQFAWAARAVALGVAREVELSQLVASAAASPAAARAARADVAAADGASSEPREGRLDGAAPAPPFVVALAAALEPDGELARASAALARQLAREGACAEPDAPTCADGRSGCSWHALCAFARAQLGARPEVRRAAPEAPRAALALVAPPPPPLESSARPAPTAWGVRLLARAHAWRASADATRARGCDGRARARARAAGAASDGSDDDGSDDDAAAASSWLELPGGLRARVPCAAEGAHLAREIFERRVYERRGVSLALGAADAAAAAAAALLVVDVGAHVGLFALRALAALPCARLVAIEPARRSCALLRANLDASGMGARATVMQAAADAGGHEGDGRRVRLRYYRHLPSNSTCAPDERERAQRGALAPWRLEAARDEWCDARSLSSILRAHGEARAIALLKVDVEGAELDVLRGLEPCDWPRVAQVVVEAHAVGDRVPRIVALLRERGGFAHVVAEPDAELAALGLDNFLIYASRGASLGEALGACDARARV